MNKLYLMLMLLGFHLTMQGQTKTENIILITYDGLRWEEVFSGAVDSLIADKTFTKDSAEINSLFSAKTAEERRTKLLPWIWSHIGTKGHIYGNRLYDNKVDCSNPHWFSYPGYNEILTGYGDPAVNSNDKKYNQNLTVLEMLNQDPGSKERLQLSVHGMYSPTSFMTSEAGYLSMQDMPMQRTLL